MQLNTLGTQCLILKVCATVPNTEHYTGEMGNYIRTGLANFIPSRLCSGLLTDEPAAFPLPGEPGGGLV